MPPSRPGLPPIRNGELGLCSSLRSLTQELPPPCQLPFLQRVGTIHDATRRALAHRPKPYSPKLIDEGPRGSILLIPSTLSAQPLEGVAKALRSHSRGSQRV